MILVTGARGVVGQPLCEALVSDSRDFIGVSRKAEIANQSVEWDLNNQLAPQQKKALAGCTVLVHCAPIWMLPNHLCDLFEVGIEQFVVFSSTSVISKKMSSDEHDKRLVESLENAEQALLKLAKEHAINLTILRPSLIYGYGLDENISHIANRIRRLKIMPLAGRACGLRQPVHADDLVSAVLAVLIKQRTGIKIYNLSGGETLSYRSMIERIFIALDMKPRFIHLPSWLFRLLLQGLAIFSSFSYTASMADRMNANLVYDSSAASNDIGYQPQKFLLHPERDLPR